MNEAYELAKSMIFYRIDHTTKGNTVTYALSDDVPAALVRNVGGVLANDLRKLGYKVRIVKGSLVVSWDVEV